MAERVYVALDLETTGLDAKRDGIIEIGAVRFQGVHILDRFVTFVNPSRTIPLRVQQITNIRNSDVTDAPRLDDVIPELLAFVRSDVTAIIAHNADFDMGFLQAAGIHLQLPVLDTFELATILLPGAGSFSLGELCRTLQIDLTDAHRALNDAEATAQLFIRLQQQLYQVDLQTLQIIAASAEQSTWQPRFLFADALDAQPLQPVAPAVGTTRGLWQQKAEHPTLAPYPVESQSTVAGDQVIQQTVSTETIESFFATDGPLAQQFAEHFEVRRGQIDMAQQVVKAFNEGAHVLLEAGTGIGKSLAYLVPAALWSVANQQR
ncbi:MAG: exonuclease domain-containing protein [Caldilineaceae bacterium]